MQNVILGQLLKGLVESPRAFQVLKQLYDGLMQDPAPIGAGFFDTSLKGLRRLTAYVLSEHIAIISYETIEKKLQSAVDNAKKALEENALHGEEELHIYTRFLPTVQYEIPVYSGVSISDAPVFLGFKTLNPKGSRKNNRILSSLFKVSPLDGGELEILQALDLDMKKDVLYPQLQYSISLQAPNFKQKGNSFFDMCVLAIRNCVEAFSSGLFINMARHSIIVGHWKYDAEVLAPLITYDNFIQFFHFLENMFSILFQIVSEELLGSYLLEDFR